MYFENYLNRSEKEFHINSTIMPVVGSQEPLKGCVCLFVCLSVCPLTYFFS